MVNYLWIKFVSLLWTDVTCAPELPLSLVFWLVAQWAPQSSRSCLHLWGWLETCAKYKIAMHKIWQFIDALLLLLLLLLINCKTALRKAHKTKFKMLLRAHSVPQKKGVVVKPSNYAPKVLKLLKGRQAVPWCWTGWFPNVYLQTARTLWGISKINTSLRDWHILSIANTFF